MKIFGFEITRRRGTPLGMKADANEDNYGSQAPDPSCSERKDWLEAFETQMVLHSPVHAIAEDCSVVQWQLFRRLKSGEKKEVLDHELLDLWKFPHPMLPRSQFVYLVSVYLDITGVAPIWMLSGTEGGKPVSIERGGKPSTLMLLAPHWMQKTPRETAHGDYEVHLPGEARPRRIPSYAVLLINRPHVKDPYGFGMGPAQSLNNEVALGRAMNKFSIRNFLNGTFLGNIIRIPMKTLADKIKAKWRARYSGIDNVGKDFFVDSSDGDVEVIPLAKGPREMGFHESREQVRDFCAQGMQVPPARLGIWEDANRSTVDVTDQHQQQYNVLPRLELIASHINRKLVSRYGRNLVLEPVNPVKETDEQMLKRISQGFNDGWVSLNEARAAFKMSVKPGGDVFKLQTSNNVYIKADGDLTVVNQQNQEASNTDPES